MPYDITAYNPAAARNKAAAAKEPNQQQTKPARRQRHRHHVGHRPDFTDRHIGIDLPGQTVIARASRCASIIALQRIELHQRDSGRVVLASNHRRVASRLENTEDCGLPIISGRSLRGSNVCFLIVFPVFVAADEKAV